MFSAIKAGIPLASEELSGVQVSPEWHPVISKILADPGVTIVVGTPDSGKTTFCLQLLNAAVGADVPAAFVDSDIGQSEIGPPGTVGMTVVAESMDSFAQLEAQKLYFVGATSPVSHLLSTVVGVKRLVDMAVSRNCKLVTVDTSGLVRGIIGRKLKTYKIDLIQPRHLVAIQRFTEVDYLLNSVSKNQDLVIHSLKAVQEVKRKPQQYRAMRRRAMFYEAFNAAQGHILKLDQVAFRNTFFTTGKPVSWHNVKEIEDILEKRILHAETIGRGFYIVTESQPETRRWSMLTERYNTREITIVPATAFQHVLVGLLDGTGLCLDVGLLQAIDFRQKYMSILSRMKTVSPVRIVQFGGMRVRPDGTEIGKLSPGEI